MELRNELDTLKGMETELYKVQAAYTKARNEYYERGKAALEIVRKSIEYTYEVQANTIRRPAVHASAGVEALKLSRICSASTALMIEKFNADYPQHAITPECQSMTYYRTREGILNSHGGGYYILETPCLCSDAQWEDLKAGIVPISFLHSFYN